MIAHILVVLLFSGPDFQTVIDISMQEFSSAETCQSAAEGITASNAHVQFRCEPK